MVLMLLNSTQCVIIKALQFAFLHLLKIKLLEVFVTLLGQAMVNMVLILKHFCSVLLTKLNKNNLIIFNILYISMLVMDLHGEEDMIYIFAVIQIQLDQVILI